MKKIYYILTILLCVYVQTANAQMGVNSTGAAPDASAMLDVRSTNKGFLLPRLTTTQRNAMPAISNGLMIYNTTTAEIEVFRGFAGWVAASRMAVPFTVSGSDPSLAIVQGSNTGAGYGVRGDAATGSGVLGYSTSGFGVEGIGNQGVYGQGVATGVRGTTTTGTGVYGESNTNRGVWGRGLTTGDGVYGDASTGKGVYGLTSSSGIGVYGNATVGGTAVQGFSNSGYGGYFESSSGVGLLAYSSSNYAFTASNTSASIPVAQFANLSGGTALELVASTAIKITGAIKVGTGSFAPAFKIVSAAGNISLNQLIIPNTTLANSSTDILMVTHNYGSGGPYLNKAYGVFWNGTSWSIYLEDLTAMPVGATFNVLVIKQ
jgi:hypothetical protein